LPASTYFTFEIDGARVGFYEEHDESVPAEDRAIPRDQEARVLRMCAWISLDGAQHLNRFAIRYVGDEIVAYLDATGAWVSLGPGAAAGTMTGAAASAATSATSNAASNAASNATASAESGATASATAYPSAALPILARRMRHGETFSYWQIDESLGRVVALATLRRDGNTVVETVDDEPRRSVVLRGRSVVAYGWGGSALSRRVASRSEAVRGTAFGVRQNGEPS